MLRSIYFTGNDGYHVLVSAPMLSFLTVYHSCKTKKIALRKSLASPNLLIQKFEFISHMKNLINKCVASPKLPQRWGISSGNNNHCWEKDSIHQIHEIEFVIDNLVNFTIRAFARCLATDHEKFKKITKNLSQLKKVVRKKEAINLIPLKPKASYQKHQHSR